MAMGLFGRISALAANLLALNGCDQMVKVTDVYRLPLFSKEIVLQAAAKGVLVAEVYGSPFKQAVEPLGSISTLNLPGGCSPGRLAPYTGPVGDPYAVEGLIRIILTFNTERLGPGRDHACKRPDILKPGPATGDKTRVSANLCTGEESISSLVAESPTPDDFNAKRYRDLKRQVMVNLLPNR